MQKWKGCSLSCVGMERVGCSTTPKATDTWGSGGKEYSRVLEHSLGETQHQQSTLAQYCNFAMCAILEMGKFLINPII